MRKIDKIIEKIVYMVFDCEVELNDPTETQEQIKIILNEWGLYKYPKDND